MANITYTDKDKNVKDGVKNKFRDLDANEIKQAVNSKADTATVAALATPFRGNFNMDAGVYPATGGTGPSGAIQKGNTFDAVLTNPDAPVTVDGKLITSGAEMRALVDAPGQISANWRISNA